MKAQEFKALSLFAGAGGMDIGVRMAGFKVLAEIEVDPYCCSTLLAAAEREQLDTTVIQADIRQVDPAELMVQLGIKRGQMDLLFGGPPCQAFSQIGKQASLEDERGMLLFQMVRFAEALNPKVIMIEQVKGLLSAKGHQGLRGEVFQMLLEDLDRLGYVPKWRVIKAADYGVPQLRERVFTVAMKKSNTFHFPTPTHAPTESASPLFELSPYVTVGQALSGLGEPAPKNGCVPKDSHVDVTPKGDRYRINGVPEGSFLAAQRHLPQQQLRNLTKKDTTKFLRLGFNKPSNTLRCGEIFFHPTENRYLTPREYMRLHGYPDDYELRGPVRSRSGRVRDLDQHRQVANSVPPPLAHAVASQIMKVLNGETV